MSDSNTWHTLFARFYAINESLEFFFLVICWKTVHGIASSSLYVLDIKQCNILSLKHIAECSAPVSAEILSITTPCFFMQNNVK